MIFIFGGYMRSAKLQQTAIERTDDAQNRLGTRKTRLFRHLKETKTMCWLLPPTTSIVTTAMDIPPVSFGFFPPKEAKIRFGVTMISNKYDVTGVSTAAIANSCKEAAGVSIGGIVNVIDTTRGLSLAGVCNVNESAYGISISGITNVASTAFSLSLAGVCNVNNSTAGIQIAGITNVAETTNAISIAGITNRTTDQFNGIAVSGIWNSLGKINGAAITCGENAIEGDGNGIFIGGIGNWISDGHGKGVFIGGLGNYVANRITGIAIGILGNISKKLAGLSISALLNIAGTMEGIAVAPFNLFASIKGISIGIINYTDLGDGNEPESPIGVQIGVLNIKKNKGWGATIVPILYIHNFSEIHAWIKTHVGKIKRTCNELRPHIYDDNNSCLRLRRQNREGLLELLQQNGEPLLTGASRPYQTDTLSLVTNDIERLKIVATEKGLTDKRRIRAVVKMLNSRGDDEKSISTRKEGATQLALVASDPEIYDETSEHALRELVGAIVKNKTGHKEARGALISLGVSEDDFKN